MVKLFQKLATGVWQIIDKFPIHFLCPTSFAIKCIKFWSFENWKIFFSIWYQNNHIFPLLCKKFGSQTNGSKIGRLSSINSEETHWRLVCQVCLEYQWEKERFQKLPRWMSGDPGPSAPRAEIFPHEIMDEIFQDHIVRLTFDFWGIRCKFPPNLLKFMQSYSEEWGGEMYGISNLNCTISAMCTTTRTVHDLRCKY